MMSLWRETFGDSLDYVRLVFDAYYSPENAFVKLVKDKIASAMLSVPYSFRTIGETENKTFKSEYFCGLATRPQYRGKGFIRGLMDEAERKAKDKGVDFITLIPASSSLREFYRSIGWKDAFPRFAYTLTSDAEELIRRIDKNCVKWTVYSNNNPHDDLFATIKSCHHFMHSAKAEYPSLCIDHDIEDLKAVFVENAISGGEIITGHSIYDEELVLMAVCNEEETGKTAVRYVHAQNYDVMASFLKFLYLRTSGNFFVNTPFSATERNMLEKLGMSGELQRYAMMKPLRDEPAISLWPSDVKNFLPSKNELVGEMFLLLD